MKTSDKKLKRKKLSDKKLYGVIAGTVCVAMIVINILIIAKVLPFDIVMGGRMNSYEQALGMFIVNLLILIFLFINIMISADLFRIPALRKICSKILAFFSAYFCINIILNLLGKTMFEKVFASIMAVVMIYCFVHIISRNKKEVL